MYRENQYRAPDPKPPSKLPLVLSAVLAIGGASALVTSLVVRRHAHRETRAVSSASAASDSAGAPFAPPPQIAPTTPAYASAPVRDLGDERGPTTPGTPRASAHARPAWAKDIGYAPQLRDALTVFLAASPTHGDVTRALVVCRIQSFNTMDTFAGDDLRVHVTFPETPMRANDGPEDANLAFVSAPLASIAKGDVVRFDVWDRDTFGDELITRAQAKYDVGPFVLADKGASIECRALRGAALDRQVSDHGERVEREGAVLAARPFDGRRPDWGFPGGALGDMAASVEDVAALVGWADPRTVKRVESLAAAEGALAAKRRQMFEDLHGASGADIDVHGLHAHFDELACGARKAAVGAISAASPCVAKLTLRNDGSDPMRFSGYGGPYPYVATASVGPLDARFDGLGVTDLAPKESREVIVTPNGLDLEKAPAIVGVCVSGTCATLLAR